MVGLATEPEKFIDAFVRVGGEFCFLIQTCSIYNVRTSSGTPTGRKKSEIFFRPNLVISFGNLV